MVPHWFKDQRKAARIRQRNLTTYGMFDQMIMNQLLMKKIDNSFLSIVSVEWEVNLQSCISTMFFGWFFKKSWVTEMPLLHLIPPELVTNSCITYDLVDLMPQGCLPILCYSIRCVFNHLNSWKSLMDCTLEHLFKYWAWVLVSFWGSCCWFEHFQFWPYSIPTKPIFEVNTCSLKKAVLD